MSRPCSTCGAPSVWSWATVDYCADHASAPLEMIGPAAWQYAGRGLAVQCGRRRPDHGADSAEVRCPHPDCGAQWVGRVGEPCAWCLRRLEVQRLYQRDLALRPPERPATDVALTRWGERLKVAADAGIITRDEAAHAWRKAVRHVAAA